MNNPPIEELKPCPFCGQRTVQRYFEKAPWQFMCLNRDCELVVYVRGGLVDKEKGFLELLEKWNTRAPQSDVNKPADFVNIDKGDVNKDALEVWLPIKGFNDYQISNLGNLKGKRGKYLKPQKQNGYQAICLDKKRKLIHRIVAENFIGDIPKRYCVAHLDGNRANNKLENLKICSYLENESHKKNHGTVLMGSKNHNSTMSEDQAKALQLVYKMLPYGNKNIFYGLFEQNVSTIKRAALGNTYGTALSYKPPYRINENGDISPVFETLDLEGFKRQPNEFMNATELTLTAGRNLLIDELKKHKRKIIG